MKQEEIFQSEVLRIEGTDFSDDLVGSVSVNQPGPNVKTDRSGIVTVTPGGAGMAELVAEEGSGLHQKLANGGFIQGIVGFENHGTMRYTIGVGIKRPSRGSDGIAFRLTISGLYSENEIKSAGA